MCPASFDLTVVANNFDDRGTIGGFPGKSRTSEVTVRSNGPSVLPATIFSSGSTRMTSPAGNVCAQDVVRAVANWALATTPDMRRAAIARNTFDTLTLLSPLNPQASRLGYTNACKR